MRDVTLVLLLCLAFVGCQQGETNDATTATETSENVGTSADTTTPAVDPTASAVAAQSTDVAETDTSVAGTSTSARTTDETAEATSTAPVAGGFPDLGTPSEAPKKARYEYMIDTFYEWPDSAVRVVAARVGNGAQFFNTKQQPRIMAFRVKQGWEIRRRFRVAGTPTEKANPFINYQRHVVVYRRQR